MQEDPADARTNTVQEWQGQKCTQVENGFYDDGLHYRDIWLISPTLE